MIAEPVPVPVSGLDPDLDPALALSDRQLLALEALLAGATLPAAAGAAGVVVSTVVRWKAEPAFADALALRRRDALEAVGARLAAGCARAVDALLALLEGEEVPPHARIRAAGLLLTAADRHFVVRDLQDRLAALERRVAGRAAAGSTPSALERRLAALDEQLADEARAAYREELACLLRGLNYADGETLRRLLDRAGAGEGELDFACLTDAEMAELRACRLKIAAKRRRAREAAGGSAAVAPVLPRHDRHRALLERALDDDDCIDPLQLNAEELAELALLEGCAPGEHLAGHARPLPPDPERARAFARLDDLPAAVPSPVVVEPDPPVPDLPEELALPEELKLLVEQVWTPCFPGRSPVPAGLEVPSATVAAAQQLLVKLDALPGGREEAFARARADLGAAGEEPRRPGDRQGLLRALENLSHPEAALNNLIFCIGRSPDANSR